jgi:hypothetical protein
VSRPSSGANAVTATSDSVAAPGVRVSPIRESLYHPHLNFAGSVLPHGLSSAHPTALNSLAHRMRIAPPVAAVARLTIESSSITRDSTSRQWLAG